MERKSSLSQLQQAFRASVKNESEDLSWVLEQKPLPADERVEIYSYAYWARLEEALVDDFPKVAEVLGEEKFSALSKEYFERHPSKYRNIGDVNSNFPFFVKTHSVLVEFPFLAELADFEWTQVESFYAHEKPRVGLEDIAQKSDEDWNKALLELDSSVRVKQYDWPVLKIFENPTEPVSKENSHVLIYRFHDRVQFEPLSEWKFRLLLRFKSGNTLSEAVDFMSSEGVESLDTETFSHWISRSIIHSIHWV